MSASFPPGFGGALGFFNGALTGPGGFAGAAGRVVVAPLPAPGVGTGDPVGVGGLAGAVGFTGPGEDLPGRGGGVAGGDGAAAKAPRPNIYTSLIQEVSLSESMYPTTTYTFRQKGGDRCDRRNDWIPTGESRVRDDAA